MRKGPPLSFSHLNLVYTTMPDTWKMLRKHLLNEIKQMDQSRERRVRFVCSSMPADNKYNRNEGYSSIASFFYTEKKTLKQGYQLSL